MSDIWIKTSNTSTTKWRKAIAVSIKRGGATWSKAKNIWIKTGTSAWLRVWPISGVFSTSDPYIATSASGTTGLYGVDGPIRIGTTYYGRNGTWDANGWTISSYSYSWPYYTSGTTGEIDQLGTLASGTYATPSNALTISSAANASAVDGKYISFNITAVASNSLYNGLANSEATYGRLRVIRRTPVNTSASLTGTASVGQTLTYSSAWNITEAYKIDTSRSTMKWYKSASNTDIYEGGSRTEISRASGSYTITLAAGDNLDGYYVIAEESVYNTGSDYAIGQDLTTKDLNRITKVTASTVTVPYTFTFGSNLYVSTNGYISMDSANSPDLVSQTTGRVLSILSGDQWQDTTTSVWYWSNTTEFRIRWEGYRYNAPSDLRQYEVIFYKDGSYATVYAISVSGTAPNTVAYSKNGTTLTSYPSALTTGSAYNVNFDGTTSPISFLGYTPKSKGVMVQVGGLTSGTQDVGYTTITTAASQVAPTPENTVSPTLTTDTGNFLVGSIITVNSGTWTGTNSYTYNLLYDSSTPVPTNAGARTLNSSNQYTITLGDATNPSYYFRAKVTGYSGSGQTGNSAIAYGVTSSRSYIDPTTTISVGTATATGFKVSGVAGPLNGIGTSYVSISKIEIFNSSYTSVASITTGLPSVDGTTGAWSYIWTGGSASTTYYAKVTAKSTDTAGTTFTTEFSTSIATSAGTVAPNSFTSSTTYNDKITLDWSGGSGTSYEFYWGSTNTETPGTNSASFTTTNTATYDWNAVRGTTYYLYIRAATGATKSSWFPTSAPGRTGYMKLYAPPAPTITNKATASASLSWYWDSPTPSTTEDYPSSWDYAQTTSSTSPTSGWTNLTTRPTTNSPLVISSLSSSTDYYLHVKAKNADASVLATPVKATTDAPAATAPPAPGTPAVGASTLTRSLSTTLYRNSNTSKDQYWSADVKSEFRVSWTASTGAASYEVYYNDTNTAPSASTSASYTGITNLYKDDYWYYGSAATTYYYWVRARNTTGASAYVSCGSKAIPALSVTSFTIRIYVGGSTTSYSSPGNTYGFGGNTSGTPSLTNGYPWRSLTTRGDPNASTPTGVGHYAWAQGTVNGGTAITATSSAV
jgi:hypothetical protein